MHLVVRWHGCSEFHVSIMVYFSVDHEFLAAKCFDGSCLAQLVVKFDNFTAVIS